MYEKILSAYVTNLGKYVEGELVGKWLDFPTTQKEIDTVLREIGIDGVRYEEFFITDYESNISGLTESLGEYESLYALNYLAEKIQESDCTFEELEALLDFAAYTGSIEEIVALLDNMDCFIIYSGVETDYDLGYYYVHELGLLEELKGSTLARYFDYEAYGRDIRLEEGGVYTQNGSYVCMLSDFHIQSADIQKEIQRVREDMRLTA